PGHSRAGWLHLPAAGAGPRHHIRARGRNRHGGSYGGGLTNRHSVAVLVVRRIGLRQFVQDGYSETRKEDGHDNRKHDSNGSPDERRTSKILLCDRDAPTESQYQQVDDVDQRNHRQEDGKHPTAKPLSVLRWRRIWQVARGQLLLLILRVLAHDCSPVCRTDVGIWDWGRSGMRIMPTQGHGAERHSVRSNARSHEQALHE